MFVIEEMIKQDCNFDNAHIGIVPIGTGNDFSRTLGWGAGGKKELIGKHLLILKLTLIDFINAEVRDFDIWEVET